MNPNNTTVYRYYNTVIKKSWTWERLTPEERERFDSLNLDVIRGADKTRVEWLNSMYNAFLVGLGYEPIGWREPDPENTPQF